MKHIITPFIFYTRTIIKGKRSGVKKWRWVIYIEEKEIIAKIHAMTKTLVASILENEKPVYVDFETQERIPKDSALWYKEVIKTNGECLSINDDRRV